MRRLLVIGVPTVVAVLVVAGSGGASFPGRGGRIVLLPVFVFAFALPFSAAAASPSPRAISWADRRHGWALCAKVDNDVCSTEDGGKTWHLIFGGGYAIYGYERTSASSGVVETGGKGDAEAFWTRTNGGRWYQLPNVPGAHFPEAYPEFAGRGSLLFWSNPGSEDLHQISGWPATTNPPCPVPYVDNVEACVLGLADSPFQSREVAKIPGGVNELAPMRSVDGGVAVVTPRGPGITNRMPSVFLYRGGASTTEALPAAPGRSEPLYPRSFAVAWPQMFVEATDTTSHVEDVLWASTDGGASWRVRLADRFPLRGIAVAAGHAGRRVAVPGGWVAPGLGAPTRVVFDFGTERGVALPRSRGCGAATLSLAWPEFYVRSGRASWWSADGGASWSVSGACRPRVRTAVG